MTLTDRFVQSIKSLDGKRADYSDHKVRGLVLRVTPAGAKSWALRYCRKSDGKQQRLTIGRYPGLSLYEARAKAQAFLTEVEQGKDPAKTTKRPDASKPRTFGELAERYLQSHATQKRSGKEDESQLRNDVLPVLEGEPLVSIDRADIAAILDTIVARGAPVRANRTFATIRKVFNWAVEKGFVATTPIAMMKQPAKEESRERILSADEIRAFWRRTIAKTRMDWEMRQLLRICLVTGQRISEVAGATLNEIDFDKAEWLIPKERAKNNRAHLVPLSPLALRLFERAAARSTHEEYLLPSRLTGKPMLKFAPSTAMRRAMPILSAPMLDGTKVFVMPATPHDLRRTLASGLGEMEFSRFVQDRVLNHSDNTIGSVYDRYAYLKEKREALEAWAARLGEIIFATRARPAVAIRTASVPMRLQSPWARR